MTTTLAASPVSLVIRPRMFERVKGFTLRRNLLDVPYLTVGPFMVFDHFGPVTFGVGQGFDAGPHPHCGIATLSYLFEGTVLHRDGMGNASVLEPGGVNWMVAGGGVAHSERTPQSARVAPSRLAGLQFWVALPAGEEACAPRVERYAAADVPVVEGEGTSLRLIAGTFAGTRSPVGTYGPTLCADVSLAAGASLAISAEHRDRAVYVLAGEARIAGEPLAPEQLYLLRPGEDVTLHADTPARLMLVGGAPLDGPRYVAGTLVASSRERLEDARAAWNEGRFPCAAVAGETDRGEPIGA